MWCLSVYKPIRIVNISTARFYKYDVTQYSVEGLVLCYDSSYKSGYLQKVDVIL